jgi:hypothetical protein
VAQIVPGDTAELLDGRSIGRQGSGAVDQEIAVLPAQEEGTKLDRLVKPQRRGR